MQDTTYLKTSLELLPTLKESQWIAKDNKSGILEVKTPSRWSFWSKGFDGELVKRITEAALDVYQSPTSNLSKELFIEILPALEGRQKRALSLNNRDEHDLYYELRKKVSAILGLPFIQGEKIITRVKIIHVTKVIEAISTPKSSTPKKVFMPKVRTGFKLGSKLLKEVIAPGQANGLKTIPIPTSIASELAFILQPVEAYEPSEEVKATFVSKALPPPPPPVTLAQLQPPPVPSQDLLFEIMNRALKKRNALNEADPKENLPAPRTKLSQERIKFLETNLIKR